MKPKRKVVKLKENDLQRIVKRILNEQMSDDGEKLLNVSVNMGETLKSMTALYHKARKGERAGADTRSEMMGGRGKGFKVRDIPEYENINRSLQEVLTQMEYVMS